MRKTYSWTTDPAGHANAIEVTIYRWSFWRWLLNLPGESYTYMIVSDSYGIYWMVAPKMHPASYEDMQEAEAMVKARAYERRLDQRIG